MKAKMSKGFKTTLARKYQRYEFEVGILEDKPYKIPKSIGPNGILKEEALTEYAGGPIRKVTSQKSGLNISEVLIANSERLGIDLLRAPFQERSSDIIKFADSYMKLIAGKINLKRVTNLIQAIVRNPILRGDYGSNSGYTEDNKGFNRYLMDTAQTFKAIKAKAEYRR